MKFEVTKIGDQEKGEANKVILETSVEDAPSVVHNLYLTEGETIWVDLPTGMVRVSLNGTPSIQIYAGRGQVFEFDKGRGVKLINPKAEARKLKKLNSTGREFQFNANVR